MMKAAETITKLNLKLLSANTEIDNLKLIMQQKELEHEAWSEVNRKKIKDLTLKNKDLEAVLVSRNAQLELLIGK